MLLCPWDFPGKSTGLRCHCLLWSSAYLRLLIFLLAILIPACASSSPGLDPVGQAMIFVSGFPGVMWGAVGCAWGLTMSRPLSRNRRWHPTPVLLPGKSHGRRSLVGCSPGGHEESDTTEQLHFHFSLFTFMHRRRKWQPTPVFLPGESQGQGSLLGCCLWGRTESDMTEVT